ncbi:DUF4407 domain-containing protein [Geodermatophilus nigrescens]|uniref:DUF4407 domain-containing protein n=1 Tax=Geodermatophilus nigrescens TaxID=1070870 RepID=A0A1M5JPU2_9ACTN|nr:DUF4407 domain-containing protein [Geodermatophilus nigrescens]SHG42013.1 protein of unknown function [Geodermatophilus nigrescens]
MAGRRRLQDRLAVLGGARPDLLESAPGARPRFAALGGVLLSTGGLAVASASFALHMALGVWWPFALLLGLGWGAVVVNLDRMLLVGMAHDASLKRNLALAVPRVGLALVLGVVVATPLTLQVFHKEIDAEITVMQAEAADAYRESLEADARFAGLDELREKVALEQDVVATGGSADPALVAVQADLTATQAAYDAALATQRDLEARAQCELDGTCGTGDAGTGEAYLQARAAADAQAGVVASARAELDDATDAAAGAEARSADLAAAALATDSAELARLTAELDRLQAAFDSTNEGSGGILLRLEALDRLSERNATLAAAKFMLSLLFMCVEILPVLMKVLLNFGPPTAYDRLAALRDSGDVDIEELQQQSRRSVAEAKEELLVMAEQERLDRQKAAIRVRRLAALAQEQIDAEEAARPVPQPAPPVDEAGRIWDTGPIRLARSAARTIRPTRRPGARVTSGV